MPVDVASIPVAPWGEFLPRWRWDQSEHVALVGPTGQGKTTLALGIMPKRSWSVVIATKPRDRTLAGLQRQGYVLTRTWPPRIASQRVLLWPRFRSMADTGHQRAVLSGALRDIFRVGGWSVLVDDVQYLTDVLGLGPELRMYWYQARSLGISLVAATQRPRRVPVEMWSQSTHAFIWRTNADDLRAVAELGVADTKLVRAAVASLPKHHVLYVNARTGAMVVTKAERGLTK